MIFSLPLDELEYQLIEAEAILSLYKITLQILEQLDTKNA